MCIAGDTVELETHDVVIRNMRFRRGETWVGDRNDSIGGNPIGNIMIDHVSASWGLDENMSMYRHMYQPPDGSQGTEAADREHHDPELDLQRGARTPTTTRSAARSAATTARFTTICGPATRAAIPSVGMIYDFTFVNNVLFNWRHRTVDGGDHRSFYSIINNYFKPGPATPHDEPIALPPAQAGVAPQPSRRSTTTARPTSPATSSKATSA